MYAGGGRAGAVLSADGPRKCERVQSGFDEPGGAADVGGHHFVDPGRCKAAVQVLAQAVGLDVPQPEQGPGRDLRLGVTRVHPGPRGQDLGSHGHELAHHVGLVCAQ